MPRRITSKRRNDPVRGQYKTSYAPSTMSMYSSTSSLNTESKLYRRSGEYGFCWFLRQISPGIVLILCFLGFKNLDRGTQLRLMGYKPFIMSAVGSANNNINNRKLSSSLRLGSRIPKTLQYLADLSVAYSPKTDIPHFFDVHFAGETIAESIFSKCHFLIQACEHGLKQPNYNDEQLQVFEHSNGALYVNVDTTTKSGIRRAQHLGLAKSKLAQVTISPHLHLFAKSIFSPSHRGRLFALFRHPVDRAVSMKHYLSKASWDPMYNPHLQNMSLQDYAKSSSIEHNWVTRFLVNKLGGKLTHDDMLTAKEILRTKCLVGLFDDMAGSMERFERYFGWTAKPSQRMESAKCRTAVLQAGDRRHDHSSVKPDSKDYRALAAANRFDLELYEYAKVLYDVQGEQIFGIEKKSQDKNKTNKQQKSSSKSPDKNKSHPKKKQQASDKKSNS